MTAKIRYALYSVFTVVTVGMRAFARTIVVLPQPVSPYADTEVSTNIQFSASSEHAREIEMRFALDGCMSNCVQVAFGKDAVGGGGAIRFRPQAAQAMRHRQHERDRRRAREIHSAGAEGQRRPYRRVLLCAGLGGMSRP